VDKVVLSIKKYIIVSVKLFYTFEGHDDFTPGFYVLNLYWVLALYRGVEGVHELRGLQEAVLRVRVAVLL
jgi:hypothetical protein